MAWRTCFVPEHNKVACVAQTTMLRRTVWARIVLVSRQTYRNKANAAARKAITIFSVRARIVSQTAYLVRWCAPLREAIHAATLAETPAETMPR